MGWGEPLKTAHDRHVDQGNCSAISTFKSWCCKRAGHTGPHGSPRVPNPDQAIGKDNPAWVDWEH